MIHWNYIKTPSFYIFHKLQSSSSSFLCYIIYTTKKALWNEQRISNTNYGHQIILRIFDVHYVVLTHCPYKYFLKVIYLSSHQSFQGHQFCVVDESHLKCWNLYELFMNWRKMLEFVWTVHDLKKKCWNFYELFMIWGKNVGICMNSSWFEEKMLEFVWTLHDLKKKCWNFYELFMIWRKNVGICMNSSWFEENTSFHVSWLIEIYKIEANILIRIDAEKTVHWNYSSLKKSDFFEWYA
jgi:hypothetical protein